jgi:4-amino-4-deoxy-L-arabinose transferase-like glycosyltransferase
MSSSRRNVAAQTLWPLLLLTIAALLLRAWRLGATPLFADEAYYLLWSHNLAPGYYDHPAGVAMLLRVSTALGGESGIGVRWLNALLSAVCVPLLYEVGRRYLSGLGGWLGAIAVAFGPVYIITGRIVFPDSLQYFLLLLNLIALYPLLRFGGDPVKWVLFGLSLGLLLNVKGTSLLYLGALVLYVALWRREWLHDRWAWLGVGVTLLVFLPWLIWGAQHDWPSLRLALSQGGGFGMERVSPLASLAHAWRYLTPPAAILAVTAVIGALIGAFRLRSGAETGVTLRNPPEWIFLGVSAACILLPMAFSAANSPRNLAFGLLPLWPLAALLASPDARPLAARLQRWVLIGLSGWLAICGIGTVTALLTPTRFPHSSGADLIRKDAAGWPQFARSLAAPEGGLLYAVDYSIAGQLAYYTGRTTYSSIGQFRYWGVPDADDWTVVAQGYIPSELVTERLKQGFAEVSGPEIGKYSSVDGEKRVYVWRAEGRAVPTVQLMDDLDFLSLASEAAQEQN